MSLEAPIVLSSGRHINNLVLTGADLVNKNIVLNGGTDSGKSYIIKYLMLLMREYIDQIIVVCPTETMTSSYEEHVSPLLVHYELALNDEGPAPSAPPGKKNKKDGDSVAEIRNKGKRFFDAVWRRQEALVLTYRKVNKLDVLASLYELIKTPETDKYLVTAYHDMRRAKEKLGMMYRGDEVMYKNEVKKLTKKLGEVYVLIYKRFITPKAAELWNMPLSKKQRFTLTHIHLNPRLLMILDDCAAELKPYATLPELRKFFYQNRHSMTTFIITAQSCTDLHPNFRTNAFITFFTEEGDASNYFENSKNGITKSEKRDAVEAMSKIFHGPRWRKMVYMRIDKTGQKLYSFTAPTVPPFTFGSRALRALCNELKTSDDDDADDSNPYSAMLSNVTG